MSIHCHSGGNTFHVSSIIMHSSLDVITARKRSLRRLCFYMCLSTGGGVVSQHALQVVSQHALQVSRGVCIPACLAGGIPACLAGLQGCVSQHALQVSRSTPKGELEGSGRGESPGPHPWGVSRSTPGGASPGTHPGGLQVHTWGVSRPTPGGFPGPHGGVSQHAQRQTSPRLTATAVGGAHLTGMHSC